VASARRLLYIVPDIMGADVSIIGAGAVGLAFADAFSRAGMSTEVVVRKERSKDLTQRGLWAKRIGCSIAPIRAAIVTEPTSQTLIMTPKTYAVEQAIEMYCRGRGSETSVIMCQNGLSSDALLKKVAPNVSDYGAIITFTSTSLKPGEVEILASEEEKLSLGLGCDADDRNLAIRESAPFGLLSRCADVMPVRSLQGGRWSKLVVNLNNALFAATNLPARRVFAHTYGPWLALTAMREGLAVAKASQIQLAKIPWASPLLMRFIAMLPDGAALALVKRRAEKLLSQDMDTLGSTLQSLRRSEPTEIDELNGAIVRFGKSLGVPTPLNAALTLAVNAQSRGGVPTTLDALVAAALETENATRAA
jgi:2-dehydropantoate 2-reductase